jgi:hypothetical protein
MDPDPNEEPCINAWYLDELDDTLAIGRRCMISPRLSDDGAVIDPMPCWWDWKFARNWD